MVIASAQPGQFDVLIWTGFGLSLLLLLASALIFFRSGVKRSRYITITTLSAVVIALLTGFFIWKESQQGQHLEADLVMRMICGDGYQAVMLIGMDIGWVGLERDGEMQYTYTRFGGTVSIEQNQALYLPRDRLVRLDLQTLSPMERPFWVKQSGQPEWIGSYQLRLSENVTSTVDALPACLSPSGETQALKFRTYKPDRYAELVDDLRGGGHDRLRQMDSAELMELGQKVYQRRCAACHGDTGQGSVVVPGLRQNRVVVGPLSGHLDVVLWGRPRTAMKAFYNQLDFVELAAVMTYQRIQWSGDEAGVQPALIAAEIQSADQGRRTF